jgi:hypothetical protein
MATTDLEMDTLSIDTRLRWLQLRQMKLVTVDGATMMTSLQTKDSSPWSNLNLRHLRLCEARRIPRPQADLPQAPSLPCPWVVVVGPSHPHDWVLELRMMEQVKE